MDKRVAQLKHTNPGTWVLLRGRYLGEYDSLGATLVAARLLFGGTPCLIRRAGARAPDPPIERGDDDHFRLDMPAGVPLALPLALTIEPAAGDVAHGFAALDLGAELDQVPAALAARAGWFAVDADTDGTPVLGGFIAPCDDGGAPVWWLPTLARRSDRLALGAATARALGLELRLGPGTAADSTSILTLRRP